MGKIKLFCDSCGKEIWRYKSQISKTGNYCSMRCVGDSQKNGSTLVCHRCDAEFYRRYGEQDRGITINQFCSKECYFEHRREYSKDSTYLKIGAVHIHRIVAESVLKRKLTKDEVVHHIDNNKKNCFPDNLAVFPNQAMHAKCHFGKMPIEEVMNYCITRIQ